MIVAIDGPAASGKGTLARRLAARYGLAYLDTGLLYRAVARAVLEAGGNLDDVAAAEAAARTLDRHDLDDPALRMRAAGEAASRVAAMPGVRAALLAFQRAFAARPPGAVLDGRDIGTVVCPDADVKLFVTASLAERARRRRLELAAGGQRVSQADLESELAARDARDAGRPVSPLVMAGDALLLDTTNLDIEAAFRAAVSLIDGAQQSA